MYTIEINFKSYSQFHPGVASLKTAKNLAENYATFPGTGVVVVKMTRRGKSNTPLTSNFLGKLFHFSVEKFFLSHNSNLK